MSAPPPAHPGDQARDRGGGVVRAVCQGAGEVRRPDNGPRRWRRDIWRRVLFTEGQLRASILVTSGRRKRSAAAPFACYSAGARRPGFAAARGPGRNHQGGTRWV